MKLLITGGKGFIARSLAEQLGGAHAVSAPGRDELDLLDAQRMAAFIKAGHFDAVLHCATYDAAPKTSTKDPARVLEYNLRMFFNLARRQGDFGRLVYFGSGAEFGREYWKPRMAEDYFDTHVPADQYGFSKYLMTKYALASENIYNLRLFGVFGKYDDWRYRFIPNLCARAALNMPLVIEQNRTMDFIGIDDLAAVAGWALTGKPRRRVYNVCSGQARDFKTLARTVLGVAGRELPVTFKAEGMGPEYTGDNAVLLSEMKGFKFRDINESVRAMYDWCVEQRSAIVPGEL